MADVIGRLRVCAVIGAFSIDARQVVAHADVCRWRVVHGEARVHTQFRAQAQPDNQVEGSDEARYSAGLVFLYLLMLYFYWLVAAVGEAGTRAACPAILLILLLLLAGVGGVAAIPAVVLPIVPACLPACLPQAADDYMKGRTECKGDIVSVISELQRLLGPQHWATVHLQRFVTGASLCCCGPLWLPTAPHAFRRQADVETSTVNPVRITYRPGQGSRRILPQLYVP